MPTSPSCVLQFWISVYFFLPLIVCSFFFFLVGCTTYEVPTQPDVRINNGAHTTRQIDERPHQQNQACQLFHNPSLPIGLPNCIPYPKRAVVDKFYVFVRHLLIHMKGSAVKSDLWVHPYTSLDYPACLIRLISMVFKVGDKCLYSCCFVEWCFQYLIYIARSYWIFR